MNGASTEIKLKLLLLAAQSRTRSDFETVFAAKRSLRFLRQRELSDSRKEVDACDDYVSE